MSFGAVHLAFHPCTTLQGIQAKANKKMPLLKGKAFLLFP
jgi:hypothetical protein